jgi:anti-sigma28 factor (negative regulator of flagellin synthesis)
MRIDSVSPKDLLLQFGRVRGKAEMGSPASSMDKAELTSEAKTFSTAFKAAREALESQAPERQRHVEEVAKKIADGTYSISGEEVARKIFGR